MFTVWATRPGDCSYSLSAAVKPSWVWVLKGLDSMFINASFHVRAGAA